MLAFTNFQDHLAVKVIVIVCAVGGIFMGYLCPAIIQDFQRHEPFAALRDVGSGGKPSTWLPPGGLVEQEPLKYSLN